MFRCRVIDKNGFCECVETRSFLFWQISQDKKNLKKSRPITNQQNLTASKSYPHLRHLKLTDPFDEKHMSIDMLIAIITTRFFQDEIIRGNENEPVAINSNLGWIVSGSFKHVRFRSGDGTNVFFC